jgi:hypothetical protein
MLTKGYTESWWRVRVPACSRRWLDDVSQPTVSRLDRGRSSAWVRARSPSYDRQDWQPTYQAPLNL